MSDEEGYIRTSLFLPRDRQTSQIDLWARIETPGYLQKIMRFAPTKMGNEDDARQLVAEKGHTFYVRVRTPKGSSQETLLGNFHVLTCQLDGEKLLHERIRPVHPDGRVPLDANKKGRYLIHAHSKGAGSQYVEHGLDPEHPQHLPDLTVSPFRSLEGVLRDPDGHPIPGHWITATPKSLDVSSRFRKKTGDLAGLYGDRVRTDENGRFTLPLLTLGEYSLRGFFQGGRSGPLARTKKGNLLKHITITESLHSIELQNQLRRLEIRVFEATGEPASFLPDETSGKIKLTLHHWEEVSWERFVGPEILGNLLVYELPEQTTPSKSYVLRSLDPEVPLLEERIQRSPDYRTQAKVTFGRRQAPSNLRIHVFDPSGKPLKSPVIRIYSDATNHELMNSVGVGYSRASRGSWSIPLPPGRYRVEASSYPFGSDIFGPVEGRAPYATQEVPLELLPKETLEISLQLGIAGHLDLIAKESFLEPTHENQVTGHEAQLYLMRANQRRAIQRFQVLPADSIEKGARGQVLRILDAIPPGEWLFQLEKDGVVRFEEHVRIRPNELAKLSW